jgi:hypothetical protein
MKSLSFVKIEIILMSSPGLLDRMEELSFIVFPKLMSDVCRLTLFCLLLGRATS